MAELFETLIYRQPDELNPKRAVWVRITHWEGSVSVATFRDKPTPKTPIWQSLTSFDFDPCFNNASKIFAWDEHMDPENANAVEVVLVENIDQWTPRQEVTNG